MIHSVVCFARFSEVFVATITPWRTCKSAEREIVAKSSSILLLPMPALKKRLAVMAILRSGSNYYSHGLGKYVVASSTLGSFAVEGPASI